MNKRKIILLAATLCMIAILGFGGTLAYLTDTDNKVNTFTVGNVDIDLKENFEDGSKLMPGIDVTKQVWVENTGSEAAYVRVHIAIPAMLDSGSEDEPQFAAYNNTLHFNMTKASYAEGAWSWGKTAAAANYPGNSGDWNEYQTPIDGKTYNVYVVTYETPVPGKTVADDGTVTYYATGVNAMEKVYFDTKVTNEMITEITKILGEIKIYVVAEGGQIEGFADAHEALDKQFGVPGTYSPFININN